jgi:hypothetical protein
MAIGPIPDFLFNTQPLNDPLEVGDRVALFGRYLLKKTPSRPDGFMAGTFVWIKDGLNSLLRKIYYFFHQKAVDEARNKIADIAGWKEDWEAISQFAKPYIKIFPDFAFYYSFCKWKLGEADPTLVKLHQSWEAKGYKIDVSEPFAPKAFLGRPLLQDLAESLLFYAAVDSPLGRQEGAHHFVRTLANRPMDENTVTLMGQILPKILFEGENEGAPIIQELRALPLSDDLKDLLEATTILPLLAARGDVSVNFENTLRRIMLARVLSMKDPLSRKILIALSHRQLDVPMNHRALPRQRAAIQRALEQGVVDSQTLFQSVVYSSPEDVDQRLDMVDLVSPKLKQKEGFFHLYHINSPTGIDCLLVNKSPTRMVFSITGRFETEDKKKYAQYSPHFVMEAVFGGGDEESLIPMLLERAYTLLPNNFLMRDAISNHLLDDYQKFMDSSPDKEALQRRLAETDKRLALNFLHPDRRERLQLEREVLLEEIQTEGFAL